ncbi:MAG TPA: hypothetical protein VLT13_02520, partial [Bacteroidota bacterium]|nr:hypothetical protein [Bacteroidota bacterium]
MSRESRVLVFVHDAMDGEMVEMQMRKAHVRCTVQRVTQKDQFLKAMRSTPPDLAIVDGAFPRLDVAGIMQYALQVSPGVPWVVLSTSQAEDALVRWMKAGAADVVTRKNYTRLGTVATELLTKHPASPAPGAAHPAPGIIRGQRVPLPGATPGTVPAPSAQLPRPAAGGPVPPPQSARPATGAPAPSSGAGHAVPPGVPPATPPSSTQPRQAAPVAPGSAAGPAHTRQAQPPGQAHQPAVPPAEASSVPLDAFGESITHAGFPPIPSPWDAMPGAPPAPVVAPPAPHAQVSPAVTPALPSARPSAQSSAREHQLFQEIVEHAGDLIAVLDEQGKRLYSNPLHAEVLDSPERLQGTTAYVDVHPDDRQMV